MFNKRGYGKSIIYLDQFAVSNMIDAPEGSLWANIKDQLIVQYEKGKLFCPLSNEHFIETSHKRFDSAKLHDSFYRSISDGWGFRTELSITSLLIAARIRKSKIANSEFFKRLKPQEYNELNHELIHGQKSIFNDNMDLTLQPQNELREITREQKNTTLTLQQLVIIKTNKCVYQIVDSLIELVNNGNLVIRMDNVGHNKYPNFIDLIIYQLLNTHKFTKNEMKKTIEEFQENGLNNISTLNVRCKLESILAYYGKKENSNDQIDIMRAATGLPFSDYFFCDKKRKHELLELKLPEKYNTKIFSGTEEDLKSFLEELKLF